MLMYPMVVSVGVVALAMGFSIPMFFPQLIGAERSSTPPEVPAAFLNFGDITTNISDPNLTRYLRISIVLQVQADKATETKLLDTMEKQKAVMTSWLLSHMAHI